MVLCRLDAPPWFCNRIWKSSSHVISSSRKDRTRLYFSDPYSNIQFMRTRLSKESKFQFGYLVDDEVSLRRESLEFSCQLPHHPLKEWCAVNSCNGLVCLVNEPVWQRDGTYHNDNSVVCVCNPILGEWISIPIPDNYDGVCALGFSAKNNQYKILLCIFTDYEKCECEWKIYTLGTGHWRSIETKENVVPWSFCLPFNIFIHGSLHWTNARAKWAKCAEFAVQSFNFETERFTVFSLPQIESAYIRGRIDVGLGVINDRLWASFHHCLELDDAEMWAMKEYGDEKSWTMTLAMRDNYGCGDYDPPDEVLLARHKELVIYKAHICIPELLFTLNGEELLVYHDGLFSCYNIKMERCRFARPYKFRRSLQRRYWDNYSWVIEYNPSFVSLHDVGKGEQVIRGEFPGKCDKFGGYKCADCGSSRYKSSTRFNSGCGWPAFFEGLPGAIDRTKDPDDGWGTEISCRACGAPCVQRGGGYT